MEVSVAYQGGGARVFELMVAAHACRALEQEKKLKIIRVSGSSAGAIAAAMFATECDIERVVNGLAGLESKVRRAFPESRLRMVPSFLRLAKGLPIYDEANVREILIDIFRLGNIDATRPINELVKNYQLRILRSDVKVNSSMNVTEASSESLADALVDSAAIPFVFRTPKTTKKPELLDGGLFQNLPTRAAAEDLKANQKVLAFSFEKFPQKIEKDLSLIGYGKSILGSLIDERVIESMGGIKESNVILLENRRSTLEFASIFSPTTASGFANEVVLVGGKIRDWRRSHYGSNGPDWHSNHPIDVAVATNAIRNQALDFFKTVKAEKYHAKLVKHEITFESLNAEQADSIHLEIHLDGSCNQGLQFFQFHYYADSETSLLRDVDVHILDANGNLRKSLLLPFRLEGAVRGIAALVCLDRPLSAGDEIRIVKVEKVYHGLSRYEREGVCWQSVRLTDGRTTDRMEIVTHFREDDFPLHYGDARPNRPADAAVYDEAGPGNQLPTTTVEQKHLKANWRSLVSTVDLRGLTGGNNFASVIYYKN
ncbi:TPA: patatin-like phospholipase family protein [Stenotrophomonas maltophilia]|nr:patatin-like phospholipase family protein [Stenotrophomonas maltophilia]